MTWPVWGDEDDTWALDAPRTSSVRELFEIGTMLDDRIVLKDDPLTNISV